MVMFDDKLHSCSICESSTDKELFIVDGKQYCCCENCFNVIKGVVLEILKEQKPKQQETKHKKKT